MIITTNLLPVGNFTRLYPLHLLHCQVLDRMLRVDDKRQCVNGQGNHFEHDTLGCRIFFFVSRNIAAGNNHVGIPIDEIHVCSMRVAAGIFS